MDPSPNDSSPESLDAFNELLVACLSRIESDGEAGLESICREYPHHSDSLRKHVQLLREAGLLESEASDDRDFPEELGDFRLIERLGAGGMGVVFLAEQRSLGRRVALKLIRPEHMFFPGSRSRFAREVEAVARLAHPGIVPVHFVGEAEGIPYFAMEYVTGSSLEKVLAEFFSRSPDELRGAELRETVARQAGTEDRLEAESDASLGPPFEGSWTDACLWIAREVAQALEHAHQRGVLHRDLKPSNVMLTVEGRVLLVDFGLASAEGSHSLTRTGSLLGSLPYMSPEQVDGHSSDVGVPADVYGLGVTLYELLALRPPFHEEIEANLRMKILEARPERLRTLVPSLSRDVEAVVSVAMSPEPGRRYASAADFARDLTRLLERRPVDARAAGPWLQLARWTGRHRGAAAAVVLAIVLAIGGPLVFGFQQLSANRRIAEQKRRADQQRDIANDERREAEGQRTLANEQRELAEDNLAKALEAVDTMLVADENLVHVPQLEQVRRELLDAAHRLYGDLESRPGGGAAVTRARASVGLSLAALDLLLGNRSEAERGLRAQIERMGELVDSEAATSADHGRLVVALIRLAPLRTEAGHAQEALELLDRAQECLGEATYARYDMLQKVGLELLIHRSRALTALGRADEALETNDISIEACRDLCAAYPEDTEARRLLSGLVSEKGQVLVSTDVERALELLEEAYELLDDVIAQDPSSIARSNQCDASVNLVEALMRLGRHEDALAVAQDGVRSASELLRDFPTLDRVREGFGVLLMNEAVALGTLERHEEALAPLSAAIEIFEELVEDEPETANLLNELGGALTNHGAILQLLGRNEESVEPMERAVEIHRRVVATQPDNPFFLYHYGVALFNWGSTRFAVHGVREAAFDQLDEALPLLAGNPDIQHHLASYWMEIAGDIEGDDELALDERTQILERCHTAALNALAAAIANGFRDTSSLGSAPVWEPIRHTPEFEALLDGVK